MKAFVIGDVHGCLDELKQLITGIDRTKTRIICVGDLIDRGPDTEGVIDFIRDNNIECVLGNHELMAIEQRHNGNLINNNYEFAFSDWVLNGGHDVYNQYVANSSIDKLVNDIDYVSSFPPFIRTGIKNEDNLELVVSHTYCLDKDLDYVEKNINTLFTFVWNRHQPVQKLNNTSYYNVFGHTPYHCTQRRVVHRTQGEVTPEPVFFDGCCNLDTGCVYNGRGAGYLSGVFFPSLKTKQVKKEFK